MHKIHDVTINIHIILNFGSPDMRIGTSGLQRLGERDREPAKTTRTVVLAKLPTIALCADQRDDVMRVERQLILAVRLVRVQSANLECAAAAARALLMECDGTLKVRH